MNLSRQIIEALRWRLVAEFMRRHGAQFTIIETHPCGGNYDCLTLLRGEESVAHLNCGASFTAWPANGENRIEGPELWSRALEEKGMRDILDHMSRCCGLEVPGKLPRTTPETLCYRVMAGVTSALALENEPWEWRNGQEDTAGYGNQDYRDAWFAQFPGAQQDRQQRKPDDPFGLAAYRYWFLLKQDEPVVCLSKAAMLWCRDGESSDLFEHYTRHRRLHRTVGLILAQC
jgi:hypothetical protein